MAGLGFKTFTVGEVLTAGDVNGYLMSQAVMVFDDATDRTAAITAPSEGMLTYNKDTGRLEVYDGSDWVEASPPGLATVQASTTTTVFFSTTSTWTDSGLSATITPRSTDSKVLVSVTQPVFLELGASAPKTQRLGVRLLRDSTAVYEPYGSPNATVGFEGLDTASGQRLLISLSYLDTPNTTSAVTYKTQGLNANATMGATFQINNSQSVMQLIEIPG